MAYANRNKIKIMGSKTQEIKLSFCAIVKPSDDEAELLFRLLNSLPDVFDEICITITGKNKRCEEVAQKFNAKISYFAWINDFAAARNFNFKQATGDYIFWADADDIIKELKPNAFKTIKERLSDKITDAVVMDYLYDFDEYHICIVRHLKTRIVRNDGCVEWSGALHEDFKQNREIIAEKSEDVQIAHLTNDARVKVAFARNTEIAKETLDKDPDDPRNFWLVANALMSEGKSEDALNYFYDFIERSKSDEEIFIAYHRLASIFDSMDDLERAFMSELQALRLRPYYPDAYYGLAKLYFKQNKFKHAEDVVLTGLSKPIPENEIIVYNPRDYDVNPLNLLARIYFAMEKPREAKLCLEKILKVYPHRKEIKDLVDLMDTEIKKVEKIEAIAKRVANSKDKDEIRRVIDETPDELKSHPAICNLRNIHFIKKEASGKDIAFYCGYTDWIWTPETAKTKGVGGSEEAIINLSRELAKMGWNVEVYNNCGLKELVFDGVKYKPYWTFNYRDKQNAVIIWRHPKILDFEINADFIGLDLHDALPAQELTPTRINRVSKIFIKSQAQRKLFPHIQDEKFAIIPNGVDVQLFADNVCQKDPYYLLNTSSPDRSLETLLDMIPEIVKKAKHKIKFAWYYGWDVWDRQYADDADAVAWKSKIQARFKQLEALGYIEGGTRLSHPEIAKKYIQAGALVYPTEFYEIDFIGGSKAQLGGAFPITSDFASLNEKIQFGTKIHSAKTIQDWTKSIHFNFGIKDLAMRDKFINAVLDYIDKAETNDMAGQRLKMSSWAKKEFNWQRIAQLWNEQLSS